MIIDRARDTDEGKADKKKDHRRRNLRARLKRRNYPIALCRRHVRPCFMVKAPSRPPCIGISISVPSKNINS
jgi:hypothetical protein